MLDYTTVVFFYPTNFENNGSLVGYYLYCIFCEQDTDTFNLDSHFQEVSFNNRSREFRSLLLLLFINLSQFCSRSTLVL